MQQFIRLTFSALAVLLAVIPARAKQAEYRRTDANYYSRASLLKADPSAVILPEAEVRRQGDSYFMTPRHRAPKKIYVEEMHDWLEPITPPSMPASLGIAPDVMQIREPQGDVQVALASAPATFVPATDNMPIPNGSVVRTGGNGSAAVLFGGIDSVRLAPNSEAAVQQTVTPQLRTTEIDLKKGAAFSKVGMRSGEKQDYEVHTPLGVAAARGTDFVTVMMPSRVDVWIAQGTVELTQPDGKVVGTVKSEGTGALKIIRTPLIADAHEAMMASAETMTAALDFIPQANLKMKALHDRMAQGVKPTAQEKTYMGLIKKVPCLIELSLIEPPPPPPVVKPVPVLKPTAMKKPSADIRAAAPKPVSAPASPPSSSTTLPAPEPQPSLGPMAPPSASNSPQGRTEASTLAGSGTSTSTTSRSKTGHAAGTAPLSTGSNDTVP
jgi:hypothetical protein